MKIRFRDQGYTPDSDTKLYIPLAECGQQSPLIDQSPQNCDLTPSGAYFDGAGYYFDGTDDYLVDAGGRKVLQDGTTGTWSSIILTDGEVPPEGSIQGTGTKIYLNIAGTAPKITGRIILYPDYCPNITALNCSSNSISVLDVSNLTSLTALYCSSNSISVLDVSNLTSLTALYCLGNPISVLDVSNLTSLVFLRCSSNSISVLDVSNSTSLVYLHCSGNSISVLDVSALTSLATLYCYNNSMDQAMVDTVLCDMAVHGTSNGTLNISGNAVPSGTGLTCRDTLVSRGWTVTVDS